MKKLLLVLAGAVAVGTVFAVEPVWPADYDAKVAARVAEWTPSGATKDKSLTTSVDARMFGWGTSAAYGSEEAPFDTWCRTSAWADAWIKLNTFPFTGFLLFLR